MAILQLSSSVSRRLKSTVLLVTPEAAVKELVDNSMDAGATIIEIHISANTIDKIQVRDNGSGVDPDDYPMLGHPSHTSKLRSFEELQFKAGSTLGFRGEALACARDISKVTIVTRTAKDSVARTFELYSKAGDPLTPRPTAAPQGTTVTLEGLYSQLPVRKREYIKKAQQSILTIKRQLLAFAMARPNISLTLKILGGNKKQDWAYRPPKAPSAKDAVAQIFDMDLVSQCA